MVNTQSCQRPSNWQPRNHEMVNKKLWLVDTYIWPGAPGGWRIGGGGVRAIKLMGWWPHAYLTIINETRRILDDKKIWTYAKKADQCQKENSDAKFNLQSNLLEVKFCMFVLPVPWPWFGIHWEIISSFHVTKFSPKEDNFKSLWRGRGMPWIKFWKLYPIC